VSIIINGCVCDSDAEMLEAIRRMVHRLTPDWRNPERFHELKSEISGALTTLLRIAVRHPLQLQIRPSPARVWPAEKPLQRANSQAPLEGEALFSLSATPPAPPCRRLTVAKLTITRIRPPRQPRARRHRYPRPPHNLKAQGELLP
jgi:hypothetical protein